MTQSKTIQSGLLLKEKATEKLLECLQGKWAQYHS